MVKSIPEEIKELRELYKNTRGQGSLEKKREINRRIKELEKANKRDEEPEEEKTVPLPPGVHEEDIPVITPPVQTRLVTGVTIEQIQAYEKQGILVGFDDIKGTALIKAKTEE